MLSADSAKRSWLGRILSLFPRLDSANRTLSSCQQNTSHTPDRIFARLQISLWLQGHTTGGAR